MLFRPWSRRSFLKVSLAGALSLICARPAFPKLPAEQSLPEGGLHEGRLALFNTHNREKLSVVYRHASGEYDPEALKAVNWILRCHYTNRATEMDIRTIEYLGAIDKELGGNNEIHIISGFRSPEYNTLLRREGRRVARHSLHLLGKAIDISIPGVNLDKVRRTALSLRYGGVGYYPGAGFVHIDSGSVRTW